MVPRVVHKDQPDLSVAIDVGIPLYLDPGNDSTAETFSARARYGPKACVETFDLLNHEKAEVHNTQNMEPNNATMPAMTSSTTALWGTKISKK